MNMSFVCGLFGALHGKCNVEACLRNTPETDILWLLKENGALCMSIC